jgi:HEAT repeat protein
MLDSDDASVRLTVLQTLRGTRDAVHYRGWRDRQAEVLQTIRGLLIDADPGVRVEALAVLAAWNQATAAEIGELLRNEDPQRIFIGLKAVVQLKKDAARLLPDIMILIDTLKLEEVSAARRRGVDERLLAVLSALKSLKTAARPAVPRLLKLSENSTSWTIIAIAQTLADIGADSEEIARHLVPLLLVETRRGPSISWRAGELLLKISPELGRRQVSLLIPRLPADDGTVDKSVLHALYALGPQAREAVPSLTPLLRDSDVKVVELAAMTLGQVGLAAAQAAPELASVISNGARPVALRLVCAGALANVGAGARSTVPDLLQLISQGEPKSPLPATPEDASEWHVRAAIVRALGNIGGDDAGLVPALRTQLSSRSPNVRMATAEAIGRAARQSQSVLADLVVRLRDGDPRVRATAALAIGRMTVERNTAVTPLIGLLLDDDRIVHSAAAVALGNIGPAAGDALPMLREILADPPPTNFFAAEPSGNPDLDSLSFVPAVRTAIEAIADQSTANGR